jgi:cell wall-associated NlpC family hydrolase
MILKVRNEPLIKLCLDYIQHFIGRPYLWAGDDPMTGFDCSGLALEFLKCAGIVKEKTDYTAEGIRVLLMSYKIDFPKAGCLVFFGQSKATHVGICLNETHMIEAGGGGSKTETLESAIQQNAYIRVRPIRNRKDILGYADPFIA